MNISYRKRAKTIIPNLEISDEDIPFGAELKATMQTEGWKVFERLVKDMEEEMQSSALAAVMLKENDREVTLKTAALLGLKTCFCLAKQYVEDVEDLADENVRRAANEQNEADYDGQV